MPTEPLPNPFGSVPFGTGVYAHRVRHHSCGFADCVVEVDFTGSRCAMPACRRCGGDIDVLVRGWREPIESAYCAECDLTWRL